MKMPVSASATARSRSASAQTTIAPLPPSSIIDGVSAPPAAAMIRRAVPEPPVKVIFATPGMRDERGADARPEARQTTFSTPGGTTSSTRRTNSSTDTDAYSDGLITSVLPAARAGPILLASVMIGEFHGMSAAMTPSGSRVVNATLPGSSSGIVVAAQVAAEPGEVAQDAGARRDVGDVRLADRAAVLRREQPRPAVGVRLDPVGHLPQDPLALRRAWCAARRRTPSRRPTAASTSSSVACGRRAHGRPTAGRSRRIPRPSRSPRRR